MALYRVTVNDDEVALVERYDRVLTPYKEGKSKITAANRREATAHILRLREIVKRHNIFMKDHDDNEGNWVR